RPDIAQRYATAVQLLAGLRGYPITVFLTPDGSAFFGGTYFPLDDPITGRGLKQLLPDVARSYREQRGSILRRAALVRERSLGDLVTAWSTTGGLRYRDQARAVARRLTGDVGRTADRTVFADRDAYVMGSILDAAVALGDSGVVVHARAALDTLLRRVYARGR